MPLTEQTTTEHETATFECEVSKPGKKVKWFRDGKEIKPKDKKYQIIADGCKHTLVVKDCTLDDRVTITARLNGENTSAPLNVEGV